MIFTDANKIYEATRKVIKCSDKSKQATQLFQVNQLLYTAMLQKDLREKKYKPSRGHKFILKERGKTRLVTNNCMADKVVNHVLCDEILTPMLKKFLIHDNGASQKGKGVSFHRRRFEQHLRKSSSNDYILLGDFKGYYANISHEEALKILAKFLKRSNFDYEDKIFAWELLKGIFETFGGSHGIDIGNQISQNIGVIFPYRFDNFAKIISGIKAYGRYSDDFYAISDSKEKLMLLMNGLREKAKESEIIINERKTRIFKLSSFFRHLQIGYKLTSKLIRKIHPKAMTRERKKLKAYKRLFETERITYEEIENNFKSWLCGNYKRMSAQQIFNIYELYKNLFRRKISKWKKRKKSRLRYLMEHRLAA